PSSLFSLKITSYTLNCTPSPFYHSAVAVLSVFAQALCPQLLQQHLCVLQVGGVKAPGEPPADPRQQLAGFAALALALPQPTQAHGRAQLQRLRPLTPGNLDSLMETALSLRMVLGRASQQQHTLEMIQPRPAAADSERLLGHPQPFFYLSHPP